MNIELDTREMSRKQGAVENLRRPRTDQPTDCLPLPPHNVPGSEVGYLPMKRAEAAPIVASYNEWVALWNRHERDGDLPLSPEWKYASTADWLGGPAEALMFRVRETGRWGVIRIRGGWNRWGKGWSFCRVPVEFSKIAWAGWEKDMEPEPQPRTTPPSTNGFAAILEASI